MMVISHKSYNFFLINKQSEKRNRLDQENKREIYNLPLYIYTLN